MVTRARQSRFGLRGARRGRGAFGARARRLGWATALWLLATVGLASGAAAQSLDELKQLSIEDLASLEITSVSKRPEPLSQAPAAVYVITGDEIRRSGAVSLPEALRLAPNLEVARVNSQSYAISARGFNSVNASDKLLVLIDGRSIYTPFFSSVFWDQQDVMLDDVDHIEVISGPGGTLWGANAVNGVINIITKSSRDTQGGLVDLKYGNLDRSGAGRWGGKLGEVGTYRGYATGFGRGNTEFPNGTGAQDDWNGKQAGFRSDFAALGSAFTVQGDLYENLIDTPGGRRNGGNLLGRWSKPLSNGSLLTVQGYYDRQDRSDPGVSDQVNTFDIEAQHDLPLGPRHAIVWGFGQRVWSDRFVNTANPFVLVPGNQTIALTNLFAQDTITLWPDVKLTLGSKLEYSSFSGLEFLPSARLGWQATPTDFLWLAVSRSVKTPSRIDRDLQAPGIVAPATIFRSEKLIAYEAGYRTQPLPQASISVSLFYNQYDDLRTTSLSPAGGFPVMFQNAMKGNTYGAEVWAEYQAQPWWRLSPGFSLLRKDLSLKAGATDIAGIQTSAGHDPGHQFFLRSYMDLPHGIEAYIGLRHVGALSGVSVPSYFELDARIGWHVTEQLELSLAGLNLVHARHAETIGPPVLEVPRSVYASARWTF